MDLHQFYHARIDGFDQQIVVLKKKKRNYGIGRLVSFIAALVAFFALLETSIFWASISAFLLLVVFITTTVWDLHNTHRLQYQLSLRRINEEELRAIDHDFSTFEDGKEFIYDTHPYNGDLDILGKHSLFQFVNRVTAMPSAALLAKRLLNPADKSLILQWQEAAKELQSDVDWRQHLQAKGRRSKLTEAAYQQLKGWTNKSNQKATRPSMLRWITWVLPAITIALIILASFGMLPWEILWLSFCAHMLVVWQADKVVAPAYEQLSQAIKAMDAFQDSLTWMISKKFKAPYLQALQQSCYHDGQPGHQLLVKLKSILNRMELRLNPLVHFPLNLAIFWDWHQYHQLQQWQQQHHLHLLQWIDAYADMEVLSSMANMAFNYPQWCFPEIADDHFTFSARSLGHPLLPEAKRVCNDASLNGTGRIMLITGSNMAGKSTFLRTLGVNMVLAMAGAPVCAKEMKISEVTVLSSMRIADNLEENISTFYAELKKLEMILKRVRAHDKVFLLLDEILRGTNSNDRHAGARAIIRQFLSEEAVGVLATHDLALTTMESEYQGQILNYHFDVQVQDDELYFDYKLKPGICTSMNASVLMRKIGIDV